MTESSCALVYMWCCPPDGPPLSLFGGGGDKNESRRAQATLLCQHGVLLPENFHEGELLLELDYRELRFSTPALVLYCEVVSKSEMSDIVASL
jgi:hypothetical protein